MLFCMQWSPSQVDVAQSPLNPKHGQKRLIAFCSLSVGKRNLKKKQQPKNKKRLAATDVQKPFCHRCVPLECRVYYNC